MHQKLIYWSIVTALGGFLFGFDTAVISGAEQDIKSLWQLTDAMHGVAIAVALYGTTIGALFGGYPAEKFGRKNTLLFIGLLYLISAVGSALAPEVYSFMLFRLIGGLGIGASSVVAPMYIAEIAPAANRGRLVALFQFNIVFGIMMAYLSNYLIQSAAWSEAWRWMLGVEAVPALIYTIMIVGIPESPRWLMMHRGNEAAARKILEVVDPQGLQEAMARLRTSIDVEGKKATLAAFFSPKYRKAVGMAFLIAIFNQLSGINAILYFAPRIFELAGLEKSSAFLQSTGVGLINIVFTMLGLYLIDKAGRKKLMLLGSIGYIVSLGAVAACFYFNALGGIAVPMLIFVFIAAHAIGQGAVIWVFISEIFPNEVRAYGQSLGAATHWIGAALITTFFPVAAALAGPAAIFFFFMLMMLLQLYWVLVKMPETKGVSLEQIDYSGPKV